MDKTLGKKRGRPRKPVLVIRLADVQQEWEERLRRTGNPKEKHSDYEISEQSLPWTDRESSGRKIRPTKVEFGESSEHRSFTQETDPELSHLQEAAADESVALHSAWMRYLEYMNVIAEARSLNDNGAELKQFFEGDARSRSEGKPPKIPAELGTPAEFKKRLADHEMEIRYTVNRRKQVIRIRVYQLPPDEEEDLDETKDPKGHWEGLKWCPDGPQ